MRKGVCSSQRCFCLVDAWNAATTGVDYEWLLEFSNVSTFLKNMGVRKWGDL